IELGCRDRPAKPLVHHHLRPELGRDEAIPVEGVRAGKNAVKVPREVLRLFMALATAGRAAHPILTNRRGAVVGLRKLHPPDVLLMDAIRSKILDESAIERTVRVECETPTERSGVPGIGRSADIAKISGGGDASDRAGVATAAKVAVLAVPLHRTCQDIDAVWWQSDA